MVAVAQNWPRISTGGPTVTHGLILMPATAGLTRHSIMSGGVPDLLGAAGGNETGTVPATAVSILLVDIWPNVGYSVGGATSNGRRLAPHSSGVTS